MPIDERNFTTEEEVETIGDLIEMLERFKKWQKFWSKRIIHKFW